MLISIKKCFTSLAPEQCILRRFVRFQLTPIRMVVINKTNKQQILMRILTKVDYYQWSLEMEIVQSLWKPIWSSLSKLNMYNSAVDVSQRHL